MPKDTTLTNAVLLERLQATQWQQRERPVGTGPDRTIQRSWECGFCGADETDGHKVGCKMAEMILDMEKNV